MQSVTFHSVLAKDSVPVKFLRGYGGPRKVFGQYRSLVRGPLRKENLGGSGDPASFGKRTIFTAGCSRLASSLANCTHVQLRWSAGRDHYLYYWCIPRDVVDDDTT
ncbi:hypothetical protein VOLCADRAFT_100310 [Volvox carteri f. nagariensis]|uniref:Uncharacterized protein n=1 Tax=Volvox carteri f. nagariensis TaxID=3068 RepID=D8UJZ0_VOLCA|nr:uncharacterized protein VOLCADRAFT_100310 [Volvox carteri f. nagariensis]EFJ39948.1 hypothetical protein VOLCADRAFT_100310 [Volvox carteri f. nagariensis]|eukprot:XP_002958973.1 hypothetical protein VOLCADRAFT_100310 [Volvox carteri f. nagariensis]